MTHITGHAGSIEVELNHSNYDRPENAIFINTTRSTPYTAEYTTVSPEKAKEIIKALQDAIKRYEDLKPKDTRLKFLRALPEGTVYSVTSNQGNRLTLLRLDRDRYKNLATPEVIRYYSEATITRPDSVDDIEILYTPKAAY